MAESPEASLEQFAEYIARNELGLALTSSEAGSAADASLDFWAAAQDAVDEMKFGADDPTHGGSREQ